MAQAAGFHLPRLEIIVAVCSSQTLEDLAEKLVETRGKNMEKRPASKTQENVGLMKNRMF